jgi:hypothetical protein
VTAYVYAILVDGVARYIGKGSNKRAYEHVQIAERINRTRAAGGKTKGTRFYNKLAKALRSGAIVSEIILVDGLSDGEAFAIEREKIAAYGGQLWNTLEGGNGLTSADAKRLNGDPEVRATISRRQHERMKSAENRKQISDTMKEHSKTPDGRAAVTRRLKARWDGPEKRDEASRLSSQIQADPDFRARMSQAVAAAKSDPEYRAKVANETRLRWVDPEYKARVAAKVRETMLKKWRETDLRQQVQKSWEVKRTSRSA